MKEELQSKLVEILTSIQGAVGKASDFAMDQIPDIAMQYMKFSMVWSAIEIVLFSIVLVAMVVAFLRCVKKYRETEWYENDGWFFLSAGSIVIGLGSAIGVIANFHKLMLISIAPKVWLIKELAGMIK